MRTFLKATIAGCVFTASLVCLAIITRSESQVSKAAIFLLSPGILAGFAVGSGRVHDVSFWILTVTLNALFYSLLAYGLVRAGRLLRSRVMAVR